MIAEISKSNFYQDLIWSLEPLISEELCRIELAQRGKLKGLCALLENSPLELHGGGGDRYLKDAVNESRHRLGVTHNQSGPQAVTVRHFGGVYFSYRQTAQLSALLSFANSQRAGKRDVILAAIMSTASEIVNTVGKQFAQPLQIRTQRERQSLILLQKLRAIDNSTYSKSSLSGWNNTGLCRKRGERTKRSVQIL